MPSYPNSKSWKIWCNGVKSQVKMAPNVTYETHEVHELKWPLRIKTLEEKLSFATCFMQLHVFYAIIF
jgi:hypothetical protein